MVVWKPIEPAFLTFRHQFKPEFRCWNSILKLGTFVMKLGTSMLTPGTSVLKL